MGRKKLEDFDYLCAYLLLFGDLYTVNPCDVYDVNEFPLYSKIPSPEKLLIKKQSFEMLSDEAKEIISTIANIPEELLSRKFIRRHFRRIWNSKFITDRTIREITTWANQL
jgi:hypothetical protein